MSEGHHKGNPTWASPQVFAAIIGGVVTIVVALIGILPQIMDDDDDSALSAPPPTGIIIEASAIPFDDVTDIPIIDTETPAEVPTSDVLSFPNLEVIFDEVSFTLRNISSVPLNLNGLVFRSDSGQWQATQWGTLINNMPQDNCLRLRDNASGQRQPPAVCSNLLGLQLVSGSALFWLNVSTFDVVYNNNVIATCVTSSSPCLVAIP